MSYILTLCSLYQFLSPYQSFDVLSDFCHLLAPSYLFTFYVIISPYKFTYCTHQNNNSFFLSYRAHALCANTTFLLIRRLWPSCHSDYGGRSDRGWGFPHRTNRSQWCGHVLANETYLFVLWGNPQPRSDPPPHSQNGTLAKDSW